MRKRLRQGVLWCRRLLLPQPVRARYRRSWKTPLGGQVLLTSADALPRGAPLVLSLGFGSALRDYSPLAELFQQRQPVLRVAHRGSDRLAGLEAGVRLLWRRLWLRETGTVAARAVRSHLHRRELRERRLAQLHAAITSALASTGSRRLDLAGHSYGTDTALMFALRYGHEVEIGTLYLFSPHPPGYLIKAEEYSRLPVERVIVITGTRDRTRDGVGPEDRLRIMDVLGPTARAIVLEGVGHMDFAFPDLGPFGWRTQLAARMETIASDEA